MVSDFVVLTSQMIYHRGGEPERVMLLWAACPCLSWSAVVMRALTWVVFVPRASFTSTLRSGSSPSPTQQRAGPSHAQNYPWTFSLHEIFTCAHLKFAVYGRKQTDIHTHNFRKCSHTSVGLAQAHPNDGVGFCHAYLRTSMKSIWRMPTTAALTLVYENGCIL